MAVVGVGSIGRRHATCLLQRGDVVVELVEPAEKMIQLAFNESTTSSLAQWQPQLTVVHASLHAMLSSGTPPDAALICTPPGMHCEQTVACLARGVHVLCEKPMALTISEGEKMRAAAAASSAVLLIGYSMHFSPALRSIRDVVMAGELGTIAHCHWHVGTLRTLINSKTNWQAAIPNALLLDYGHQPDSLFWLLGEAPSSVYAVAAKTAPIPCPE
eukprot:SAG31_NODE_9175_length_1321_cov_1.826514_1_plen_215_part_01